MSWTPGKEDNNGSDPDSHLKVNFRGIIDKNCPKTGDNYLIIGGSGFLGNRIIEVLLERGEENITSFDISRPPNDKTNDKVKFIQGDVTKYDQLEAACSGIDTIFATFAIIRFMDNLKHQFPLSERINVGGTRNVLRACKSCGIKRLIQTSTSNVVVAYNKQGKGVLQTLDDNSPYVDQNTTLSHYGYTKAIAEKLVLEEANNNNTRIVTIRPYSCIFGLNSIGTRVALKTNQAMFLSKLTKTAKQDFVYIDNVVYAHLLAEANISRDDVAGEVFSISNEDPIRCIDFWKRVQHYRPLLSIKAIPRPISYAIAYTVQLIKRITKDKFPKGDTAMLTPPTLRVAEANFVLNVSSESKARRLLGYKPIYTVDQGIQRLLYNYDKMKSGK